MAQSPPWAQHTFSVHLQHIKYKITSLCIGKKRQYDHSTLFCDLFIRFFCIQKVKSFKTNWNYLVVLVIWPRKNSFKSSDYII